MMRRSARATCYVLAAGAALASSACGAGTTQVFLDLGKTLCYDQRAAAQCVSLGDHYMGISAFAMANNWTHEVDPRQAARAYAAGCQGGDAPACGRLLALHLGGDDAALQQRAAQIVAASSLWSDPEEQLRRDVAMARLTAADIDVANAERAEREAEEAASKPSVLETLAGAASLEANLLKTQAKIPGVGAKAAKDLGHAAKVAGTASDVARKLDAVIPAAQASQARIARVTGTTFPAISMPPGALTDACDEGCALAQYLCKSGVVGGCRAIGSDYQTGQAGLAHDVSRAAQIFEATCAADPHIGCLELGFLYARGEGSVRRDRDRALAAMKRACGATGIHQASACGQVKLLEQSSTNAPAMPPGVLDDPTCRAAPSCASMSDDCARGNASSCQALAGMYTYGNGGAPKSPARAAGIRQVLCTAGAATDCMLLAIMMAAGDGVPLDKARAMELMKTSCDSKVAAACSMVGAWGDQPYASSRLGPLCDAKDALGCSYLMQDPARRDHALQQIHALCDGGDSMACSLRDALARAGQH
jgi:TPR repeat protein